MTRVARRERQARVAGKRAWAPEHPMHALAVLGVWIGLALTGMLATGCGGDQRAPLPGSTLQRTLIDADGDGALERGPAEPLLTRTTLGRPAPTSRVLATVGIISDAHVRDEESPARLPFLDRFGSPVDSTFRPHEALSAQVLDAAVRAVRAQHPDAVLVMGDLIDNAQSNELELAIAVLRGDLARPDSGAAGYDGPQRAGNPDPLFYRPDVDAPRYPGLLERAQQPFRAAGLGVPILPLLGNHDLLVQGELPSDDRTRSLATGDSVVTTLRERPRLAQTASRAERIAAIRALLAGPPPGPERRVAADAERRQLGRKEAVSRLRSIAELPDAPEGGLDYGADVGPSLRVLALDAVERRGGSEGRIQTHQLAWLAAQLRRAGRRAIIVATHQPLRSSRGGAAVLRLMDRSPAVVAAVSGHTHRHSITPRVTARGGYWLIETASLADHPQQARMLRVVRTRDGGRALQTWVVDHDGGGLAAIARDLAYLDVQGGRPRRLDAGRRDRNARLGVPSR